MQGNKLELLAPAGSMIALKAAINNGADAVYIGGKSFSARKFASNFTDEEIIQAIQYVHLRNKKIYVTVNTLIDEKEIWEAINFINFLYINGVDAVIVQDIGLCKLIAENFPDLDIHASTQMTINNLEGFKLLEDMGVKRVVVARETPLSEIKRMRDNTNIEIEAFIHGALCFSYSGQCLMSSLIGGRSGNRGACAQPCRKKYCICESGKKVESDAKYYLSTRDLNTIDYLEELIKAGVTSFKIEGRMKRPEYVAIACSAYRKGLDGELIDDDDKKNLYEIFNRKFTKGIMLGDYGANLMAIDRPNNRGVVIGKVIESNNYMAKVKLLDKISAGDGLEFLNIKRETVGLTSKFEGCANDIIEFDIKNIKNKSNVIRTSNKKLIDKAIKSYEVENKIPISLIVKLKKGKKAKLEFNLDDHKIEVVSKEMVEEAKNMPLNYQLLKKQLSKLGNTPFYLENLECEIDEDAFLDIKLINEMRREAISKILNKITNIQGRKEIYLKETLMESKTHTKKKSKPKLEVKISSQRQFDEIDFSKINRIIFDFKENIEQNLLKAKMNNIETYLSTDVIVYEREIKDFNFTIEALNDSLDGIAVSNLGMLYNILHNFDKKILADIGLNIFNSYSANLLINKGIDTIVLSPELNLSQIKNMTDKIKGDVSYAVYGYLPAMVTRSCPFATVKGCIDEKNCYSCNYRSGHYLKDEKGYFFRVEKKTGYSVIYNSMPLMILEEIKEINKAGIDWFRLNFTSEQSIDEIIDIYHEFLNEKITKKEVGDFLEDFKKKQQITKGHINRGIL